MNNERIDYKHFASKYTYGTGQDGANWTKAELKILLDEINRCYEEIDALRSITQDWVKIETFTDDGKDLSVDMEDSDGNRFSGYINRASE